MSFLNKKFLFGFLSISFILIILSILFIYFSQSNITVLSDEEVEKMKKRPFYNQQVLCNENFIDSPILCKYKCIESLRHEIEICNQE